MQKKISDRRTGPDRRRRPTPPLSIYSFVGRRRRLRREGESAFGYYVDRYSLRAVLVVLGVVTLGVLDGLFTLYLVQHGAEEINPVMAFFLNLGAGPFLAAKYTLTGVSILALLIHKNYYLGKTRISVKHIVVLIFFFYALLIVYELFLIQMT
jgi:hypothetical protein